MMGNAMKVVKVTTMLMIRSWLNEDDAGQVVFCTVALLLVLIRNCFFETDGLFFTTFSFSFLFSWPGSTMYLYVYKYIVLASCKKQSVYLPFKTLGVGHQVVLHPCHVFPLTIYLNQSFSLWILLPHFLLFIPFIFKPHSSVLRPTIFPNICSSHL